MTRIQMDSVIEYIVFIIFLISILNGIFGKKKKKQQQQKAQAERKAQPKSGAAKSVPEKKTQDILEELFGLKMSPEERIDSKEAVADKNLDTKLEAEKFQRVDTWDPEDEFKEVDYSTSEMIQNKFTPRQYQSKSKDLEPVQRIRASEKYHSIAKKVEHNTNKRRKEIKKKLNNPKTIRDYIIVQELLNEPKAFRI